MTILVAIYSPFLAWRIPEAQVAWLREAFPGHSFVRADSDAEMVARIGEADIAFSSLVDAAALAAAPRLRWIHSPAAGVGGMLFPALVQSDVVVTNSRGNSAATIAEHVIAVTLALMRRLPRAWQAQEERRWAQDELSAAGAIRTLHGSRVLVIGLGAIGAAVATRALAFGAGVVGVRRHVHAPSPSGLAAVVPPGQLDVQLPAADVVVVAAPQTTETRHLIGAPQLAAMKEDAVLVNVSRGGLIDQAALVRALEAGRPGAVALDVFEHEPLPPDSPLWSHPRVLITPHVAGIHANYWPDAAALFADNLRRFLAGQPLRNVVDKHAGY
ncbi:MAG TPA: D-2-hydroxyacid dehydrogenase [Vicinamibacterales bacterium]|nr:D-2-hydroxyacid dehydrogenase [Vicinamibacterales bacterium]